MATIQIIVITSSYQVSLKYSAATHKHTVQFDTSVILSSDVVLRTSLSLKENLAIFKTLQAKTRPLFNNPKSWSLKKNPNLNKPNQTWNSQIPNLSEFFNNLILVSDYRHFVVHSSAIWTTSVKNVRKLLNCLHQRKYHYSNHVVDADSAIFVFSWCSDKSRHALAIHDPDCIRHRLNRASLESNKKPINNGQIESKNDRIKSQSCEKVAKLMM